MSIHNQLGRLHRQKVVELRVQVSPRELTDRIGRGVTRYPVDLTGPNVSVGPPAASAGAAARRELQALAKEADLPATGSATALRARLAAAIRGKTSE